MILKEAQPCIWERKNVCWAPSENIVKQKTDDEIVPCPTQPLDEQACYKALKVTQLGE